MFETATPPCKGGGEGESEKERRNTEFPLTSSCQLSNYKNGDRFIGITDHNGRRNRLNVSWFNTWIVEEGDNIIAKET